MSNHLGLYVTSHDINCVIGQRFPSQNSGPYCNYSYDVLIHSDDDNIVLNILWVCISRLKFDSNGQKLNLSLFFLFFSGFDELILDMPYQRIFVFTLNLLRDFRSCRSSW